MGQSLEILEKDDVEDLRIPKPHSMFSSHASATGRRERVRNSFEESCASDRCQEEWNLLPSHPGNISITFLAPRCVSGTALDIELMTRKQDLPLRGRHTSGTSEDT